MTADLRQELISFLVPAAVEAMEIIRAAQVSGGPDLIEVKPQDGSLVTPVDCQVEQAVRARFAGQFPDVGDQVTWWGEELGGSLTNLGYAKYLMVCDPVDGMRPFANRHSGGCTFILYVYDLATRRMVAAVIGSPGTGELWLANGNVTERYAVHRGGGVSFLNRCRVWRFDPAIKMPTVYIDNTNPSSRNGVGLLDVPRILHLEAAILRAGYTRLAIGSGAMHHALLVSGGPVIGTITAISGGIHDLGGIKLVQNAGGCMTAFAIMPDGSLRSVSPELDLITSGGYHFLVMAIDYERLQRLTAMFTAAYKLEE